MARIDNLNNFLTDVAGAIREKTGKKDAINPASFDTEIASIITQTVEPAEMYFIVNGQEQKDITEGYRFEEPVHLLDNANAVKQTEESFNMYSGMWARGNVIFNRVLDLSACTYLYVDFEFPSTDCTSNAMQYIDITIKLIDAETEEDLLEHQILQGKTTKRTTAQILVNNITTPCKLLLTTANLTGTNGLGNAPYTEAYPARFFNIWFDIPAPKKEILLQEKTIQIKENGLHTLLPDDGYDGISQIELDIQVEQQSDLWLVKNGVEQEYNTKGSTFSLQAGDNQPSSLISENGYTAICAKVWSSWDWTFNTVIELSQYKALHVDWDYVACDSTNARDHSQFDLKFKGQSSSYHVKEGTGPAERHIVTILLDDTLVDDQVTVSIANTGETSNYLNYPMRIYNIWLEARRTDAELTEYTNKLEVQRNTLNELVEKLHRKIKGGYDE